MKKQVLVIHGGTTYASTKKYIDDLQNKPIDLDRFRYQPSWKETLAKDLGDDFDVLQPKMPNATYAKYREWALWFERIVPHMQNAVVIGHSLGGIFLAKYFATHALPPHLKRIILVAAPYKDDLPVEDLATFSLPKNLRLLHGIQDRMVFFYSKDDPIVPFKDCAMYKNELPNAHYIVLDGMGHFNVPSLPEILPVIKQAF